MDLCACLWVFFFACLSFDFGTIMVLQYGLSVISRQNGPNEKKILRFGKYMTSKFQRVWCVPNEIILDSMLLVDVSNSMFYLGQVGFHSTMKYKHILRY